MGRAGRWLTPGMLIAVVFSTVVACQSGTETSGGSGSAAAGGGGDAEKGKQAFMSTCATCHGLDAAGVKGLGKSLKQNDFVKQSSDDQLIAMIKEGRAADDPKNTTGVMMPPKGGNPGLTDDDLRNVIAYLRTLQ
ncbi:MAG: hypothetical protein QOD06_970 [Candidatus Binatota bacterium]|nr:hypothetical protein [Candidatus Binatota bacterium]